MFTQFHKHWMSLLPLVLFNLLNPLFAVVSPAANDPTLDPKAEAATSFFYQGTGQESQGNYEQAIEYYQEAVKAKPDYADAHARLGVTLARKGQFDEAIVALNKAVTMNPKSDQYHYDLGVAYEKKGLIDKAIEMYKEVVRINPSHFEAYNNLGSAYNAKGLLDEAIAAYKEAVRIQPESAKLHYNLGIAYVKKGLFNHAIAEYQEAIRINPKMAEAYNNLGVAYSQTWQIDKAVQAFKTALAIQPAMKEAKDNLQETLRDQALMDTLIEEYQEAVNKNPDSPEARYNLGVAYAKKRMFDRALDEFQAAKQISQNGRAAQKERKKPATPPERVPAVDTAAANKSVLLKHVAQSEVLSPKSAPKESSRLSQTEVRNQKPTGPQDTTEAAEAGAIPTPPPPTPKLAAPTLAAQNRPAPSGAKRGKSYIIQVSAHQEQAMAYKVAADLKRAGVTAYVVRAEIPGQGAWFRVRMGEFNNVVEAKAYAQKLKREKIIDTYIILDASGKN